jgi:hypothetical protein
MKNCVLIIAIFLTSLFCFSIVNAAASDDIKFMVSEVKDTRTTGEFFAGLDLKLKIIGDTISDSKGIRTKITKAVDDTGKNLLKSEESGTDFEEINEYSKGEITLELNNPSRKATSIKELAGEIEIFIPKNDPMATSTIKNFLTQTGKIISNPSLKSEKVEITVLTKKEYEKIKEQKQKEVKKEAGEIGDALVKAFGTLFGGFMEIDENSVILHIKDPDKKVIAIEFMDDKGKKLDSQGSMKMEDIRVFQFDEPLPQKAQITIFLLTPKSLMTTELKLTDIVLP